ncbi:MAG TPA: SUMF1/EgtB/PvdO family nonheme iron enzyme [Polyangiaceae bacterium]|jgi:formylglycine-generating enzyme required for sulfatase activity|nr:MAG: Serine/threonine-protein kinase pkn1 [Deltaproteobacteria bacterium ADurb.Bin207]HNS96446.1 SUMF1/EgtB/PvdO family nonheme iron enzyme [Polyangiaceae bacterium]HNZ22380.1 SUMF1/EgtB/PvdO family nonheme iron enzyme [Polyangiaceae bacterium]HOD20914.1 SUMF1/EgtB/PvdO family nonheme iron enzyme [Polyangiaceae bacterium]HOE48273.1 SUMF1/EgtB/PvdO family nonheme iron enzyme [Polyangiaceae bacterium]
MIEQRILGAVFITAVWFAAMGCNDDKKAQGVAEPSAVSAVPVESTSPPVDEPPVEAKPEPTPLVNEMVLIPAGSFMMGSDDGEKDEKPPRRVSVKAFEIDVHEVTLRSYMACINEGKCTYPDYDSFCNWGKETRNDDPMNCLDWEQAKAYCESVGKRLPTEAEWEYAARGTDDRVYGWGKTDPPKGLCFNRGRKGTCRVDSVPIDSPFGLRGMAGNVWEWTSDGYNADYSKPRSKEQIVYRGGSFLETDLSDLRATSRNTRISKVRMDYLGFRCARTPGAKRKQ